MNWIDTLTTRIKAAISTTDNPTQKKVFLEWIQLCREADKEQVDQLKGIRTALRDLGTHKDGCKAVRVPGRFGSRSGLRWSVSDEDYLTCDCGFAKALS